MSTPGSDQADPAGEREARRAERNQRRGAPTASSEPEGARPEPAGVMIPSRTKRLPLEAPLMRGVATAGVIAIGVVIAAIMTSQHSQGWLIGLVVSIVSLVLAAFLWSSRRL